MTAVEAWKIANEESYFKHIRFEASKGMFHTMLYFDDEVSAKETKESLESNGYNCTSVFKMVSICSSPYYFRVSWQNSVLAE